MTTQYTIRYILPEGYCLYLSQLPCRGYTWNWTAKTMLAHTRSFSPSFRAMYGVTWRIERRPLDSFSHWPFRSFAEATQ